MRCIQVAFATDMEYFEPALVAMTSVLRFVSRPARVYFLGHELTDAAQRKLEAACRHFPGTNLHYHRISTDMLAGLSGKRGYLTPVSLGRLYLPKLVRGQVLYLDSDTITYGDIAPLFDFEMNGSLISAVRDTVNLKYYYKYNSKIYITLKKIKNCNKVKKRLEHRAKLMAPFPIYDYFNSGVLLMDCDAITAVEGLLERMTDTIAAGQHILPDQDHLNTLFKGRVAFLEPKWNCSRGSIRHDMRFLAPVQPRISRHQTSSPIIVHFYGPRKPWQRLGFYDRMRLGYRQVTRYRRTANELVHRICE